LGAAAANLQREKGARLQERQLQLSALLLGPQPLTLKPGPYTTRCVEVSWWGS
jgi:hypothetical protein